jgi:hypothetical protein
VSKAPDESNIGIWLWFVLLAEIVLTVVAMDVWLVHKGHEMLTTEFREGLKDPVWGVVLAAASAAVIGAAVWHFFIEKNPGAS